MARGVREQLPPPQPNLSMKGRCNTAPNSQERQILTRWAEQEGLRVGGFVAND